jgi:hypothetical protein
MKGRGAADTRAKRRPGSGTLCHLSARKALFAADFLDEPRVNWLDGELSY